MSSSKILSKLVLRLLVRFKCLLTIALTLYGPAILPEKLFLPVLASKTAALHKLLLSLKQVILRLKLSLNDCNSLLVLNFWYQ